MKLCFMTFACPEWTLDEVIRGAERHGYDGVEPRVTANHKHGIEPDMPAEARKRVRTTFEGSPVSIGCIATSCRFATDEPDKRAENVENMRRHIALAADLGARRIRVFGGKRPEGLELGDAIAIVAEDLAKGADEAAQAQVQVCLETHDDFWLGQSVGRVLEKVNHPAVAANWDVQHTFRAGESLDETMKWLGGRIGHTHMHDNQDGRAALPGEGDLPLADDLAALRALNYEGHLSAELWPEVGEPDYILSEYARRMRELMGRYP
jgi:sugar phosphate isomerase/epimerase